jgi:hypothetical protein
VGVHGHAQAVVGQSAVAPSASEWRSSQLRTSRSNASAHDEEKQVSLTEVA